MRMTRAAESMIQALSPLLGTGAGWRPELPRQPPAAAGAAPASTAAAAAGADGGAAAGAAFFLGQAGAPRVTAPPGPAWQIGVSWVAP